MKKSLIVVVAMLVLVCLVGCGSADKKTESNQSTVQMADLPDEELAAAAAKNLGVPDEYGITYEIGKKQYWEEAQVHYKNIIFYENGEKVASADVNPTNGAPLKSMFLYER